MNFKLFLESTELHSIDPDDLFDTKYSYTFIYSKNGQLHWDNGSVTHTVLLFDPSVFNEVYGNKAKRVPDSVKKQFATLSRFEGWKIPRELSDLFIRYEAMYSSFAAIDIGDAICGRTGERGNYMIISTWNGLVSKDSKFYQSYINMCKEIVETFNYNPDKVMVVPYNHDAIKYVELISGSEAKKTNYRKEVFSIGNEKYTLEQLTNFKKYLHIKPSSDPERQKAQEVLCHQDMNKYPKLMRLMPNCQKTNVLKGRSAWSLALRKANLPDYLNQESVDI